MAIDIAADANNKARNMDDSPISNILRSSAEGMLRKAEPAGAPLVSTSGRVGEVPSAVGRVSAVGMEHLARHVARVFAGQEQEARSDFVWLSGAAHGRAFTEMRDLFRR